MDFLRVLDSYAARMGIPADVVRARFQGQGSAILGITERTQRTWEAYRAGLKPAKPVDRKRR
jgi:hypothetical protein